MTRLKIIFAALLMSWPLHALAGPAEDASAAIDRWAAAFSANDANALVKLYTSDALLHGIASPKLHHPTLMQSKAQRTLIDFR